MRYLGLIVFLTACAPPPPDPMHYFKDRYGICYAAMDQETDHGDRVSSITSVPCDKVQL